MNVRPTPSPGLGRIRVGGLASHNTTMDMVANFLSYNGVVSPILVIFYGVYCFSDKLVG